MRKIVVIAFILALTSVGMVLSAGVNPNAPEYDAWKQQQVNTPEVLAKPSQPSTSFSNFKNDSRDCPLLVPLDSTFTLAMSPNDDGSTPNIPLPFTFTLYGVEFTSCWVNNNGNVTFDRGLSSYTPWGFPSGNNAMLAPFFADVDTRGGGGAVWYKIEANRMIVIWDHVGYYSYGVDKLNTFELIFSDGTDPLIGLGNNVAFSYADMAWTTGGASGGSGGFYGSPATVGINKGDNVEYAQIGRFDHAGIDYDGPYDNNDGVDWLDCQTFLFNTGGEASNVAPVFVSLPPSPVTLTVGDTWTYTVTVISPESDQITDAIVTVYPPIPAGLSYVVNPANTCTIDLTVTASAANVGSWLVTIIATDNGTPNLSAGNEFEIVIEDEENVPVQLSSFVATLTAQNYVNLAWASQSESNMLGYRVYRNDTPNDDSSILITPVLIPATNTSELHTYNLTDIEVEIGSTYYYWLEGVNVNTSQFFGPISIVVQGEVPPVMPEIAALKNAYPNPFKANSSTTIEVALKAGENGTVTIYNVQGKMVKTFSVSEGTHNIVWNGMDSQNNACSSGIYFYKLNSPSLNQTKKMVILK